MSEKFLAVRRFAAKHVGARLGGNPRRQHFCLPFLPLTHGRPHSSPSPGWGWGLGTCHATAHPLPPERSTCKAQTCSLDQKAHDDSGPQGDEGSSYTHKKSYQVAVLLPFFFFLRLKKLAEHMDFPFHSYLFFFKALLHFLISFFPEVGGILNKHARLERRTHAED